MSEETASLAALFKTCCRPDTNDTNDVNDAHAAPALSGDAPIHSIDEEKQSISFARLSTPEFHVESSCESPIRPEGDSPCSPPGDSQQMVVGFAADGSDNPSRQGSKDGVRSARLQTGGDSMNMERDSSYDGTMSMKSAFGNAISVVKVYDYYDPAHGTVQSMDMSGDVIHKRGVESQRNSLRKQSKSSNEVSSSAGSDASSGEDPHIEEHAIIDTTESGRKAITHWGVLVGKALWCRVHGKLKNHHRRRQRCVTLGGMALTWKLKRASSAKSTKKDLGTFPSYQRVIATNRARIVYSQACELARRVAKEPSDCRDCDWPTEGYELLEFLFSVEYADTIMILAKGAHKIFSAQPMMVETAAPCKIFGDTHGQLRDLLLLFRAFGTPEMDSDTTFVFNGDFVDRGHHQLEVVSLLFALKILMPNQVFLTRGNHEDRVMNAKYGFQKECSRLLGMELGPKTYELMQAAFGYLPLACLISERILVIHGGIGNGKWSLDDLHSVRRPLLSSDIYSPNNEWIFNILWSDPIEDDRSSADAVFGVHSSPRNSRAIHFGWNVTHQFCAQNGLGLVVRSHQCKENGYGFDIMHDERLIRVFSARDYEKNGNDCAVLHISPGGGSALSIKPQVLRSVSRAGNRQRGHAVSQ